MTAQLLYEVAGPRYLNPDVTARFDTVQLEQVGPDRVRVHGVVGEPPPQTSKVCLNLAGGVKASLAFPLVGLDIEAKADLLQRTLLAHLPQDSYSSVDVDLVRTDQADPARNEVAAAQLRLTFKDSSLDLSASRLGKQLTAAVVELGLASYPGFHGGPSQTQVYGVYWPALVPSDLLTHVVDVDGDVRRGAPGPRWSGAAGADRARPARAGWGAGRADAAGTGGRARGPATREATRTSASGCAPTSSSPGWLGFSPSRSSAG